MHHPTDRIAHTTASVTPVVEHWLEREIAQWVHPMKDRSDDPSHHERMLLPRSYISIPCLNEGHVLQCTQTVFYRITFYRCLLLTQDFSSNDVPTHFPIDRRKEMLYLTTHLCCMSGTRWDIIYRAEHGH